MPSPEKKKRNEKLITMRVKNPKDWSFEKLARYFKINRVTAYQIYKRDVDKVLARVLDKS